MISDDALLDNDRQNEFMEALQKSRFSVYKFYFGLILTALVVNYFLDTYAVLIGFISARLFFDLVKINDFKYIYYHENEGNSFSLYLFNLKGKRARFLLQEKDLKTLEISSDGKTISIPSIGNKELNVVGTFSSDEISEVISDIKSKIV